MDFRRINEDTVQCILTEEEMNEYGFQIEDFFSDKEKSRSFLEHIVEKAEEEVGYDAKGGMVSMQIMRMPNNALSITISGQDSPDGFQNMLQHIQNLAGITDDGTMEEIAGKLGETISNIDFPRKTGESKGAQGKFNNPVDEKEYQQHLKELEKINREKEKQRIIAPKVFRFEKFSDLEKLGVAITINKNINSSVYKEEKPTAYYLFVKKGRLKIEEYQLLCQQISEFGQFSSQQMYVEEYCKEHFEPLIPKQAIKILKEINA